MSRVLTRVLRGLPEEGSVRPRLPALFEPGLDILTQTDVVPAEGDDVAPPPVLSAGPAAMALYALPPTARPAPEPPLVASALPGIGEPALEQDAPPKSPQSSPLDPILPPVRGPRRPEDASAPRLVRPEPAPARRAPRQPVRREPALPTPASVAEPRAFRRQRPDDAAAITPMTPADQPPPMRREPGRRRQEPYTSHAAPARQVADVANAEPTVHITIGQVEIRAERTPQPARPARRRQAAPDLSEYLQRRRQAR
jgi:hypothetical protein